MFNQEQRSLLKKSTRISYQSTDFRSGTPFLYYLEKMDDQTAILGQEPNRPMLKRWLAGSAILIVLTLERIAFYSVAGNMFLFLNQKPFLWMSYNAMTATLILTGVSYVCSIIGGWLADSVLGRYWTIFVGLIIYLGGYSVLPALAQSKRALPNMCHYSSVSELAWTPNATLEHLNLSISEDSFYEELLYDESGQPCSWLIYTVLIAIGMGVGLVKTNLAPFGADQVQQTGLEGIRIFFNWFYWCVNIGGLVAVGAIAYIQQSTNDGFFLGYIIPTGCLAVAFFILLFGHNLFIIHKPVGSILTTVFLILKEACKLRIRRKEWIQYHREMTEKPSCLDMAKVQFGGKFHESSVDDVKRLGKILLVFIALIPYWLLYFQMQTTFLVQGLHMRLSQKTENTSLSRNELEASPEVETFKIPAAWLTLFDIVFLLAFIPLMDRVIYPCFDRRNINIPLFARMGLGMFFAVLAMVVAGSLETFRLYVVNVKNETFIQIIGNTTFYAADMWIFWQIPQYSLIGLSEVFASVAGLEFAYRHAPKSMQSIVMGLFSMSTGVGSFLGTGLLNAFRHVWLVDKDAGNINFGHLDYYFYLLAGIQFVAFIFFVIFAKVSKPMTAPLIERRDNESDNASEDSILDN